MTMTEADTVHPYRKGMSVVDFVRISRPDAERLARLSRLAHRVFYLAAFAPDGVVRGSVRTLVRKLRLRDRRTERASEVEAAVRELEREGLVAAEWSDGEMVQVRVLVTVLSGNFEIEGVA